MACVELKGIKNMFTLRTRNHELDDYLILSFDSETHVLFINGEELEDTRIAGFFRISYASFNGTVLTLSLKLIFKQSKFHEIRF